MGARGFGWPRARGIARGERERLGARSLARPPTTARGAPARGRLAAARHAADLWASWVTSAPRRFGSCCRARRSSSTPPTRNGSAWRRSEAWGSPRTATPCERWLRCARARPGTAYSWGTAEENANLLDDGDPLFVSMERVAPERTSADAARRHDFRRDDGRLDPKSVVIFALCSRSCR